MLSKCSGKQLEHVKSEIKEINNGSHNVSVSFIISGTLKNATQFTEPDILNKQYEKYINA